MDMVTPVSASQPNDFAKTGVVDGAAKKKMRSEHTAGAPKWPMPYGNQANRSRMG